MSLILATFALLAGFQAYRLYTQKQELAVKSLKIGQQINFLEDENANLASDIEHFSDTRNLLKELQALFNYKRPDEKLFIVVPETGG